jgi:hypothetical protein
MADKDRGEQKATKRDMPAGAVNMHKMMKAGATRQEAERKALTTEQVEPKKR